MLYQNSQLAIGVLAHHWDTKLALNKLKNSGFPLTQVSVLTPRDNPQDAITGIFDRNQINNSRVNEGIFGSLIDIFGSVKLLILSDVGAAMVTGIFAVESENSLVNTLVKLGISYYQAKFYHNRITQGKSLILLEGTKSEIYFATRIISNVFVEEWEMCEPKFLNKMEIA